MRVLLVYIATEYINMPVLPLGMACIAASLQHAGYEVKQAVVVQQGGHSLLNEVLRAFKPDVIGISVRNIDDQNMENPLFLLDPVKEAITYCRTLAEAPIVLGGAGYSIFPQRALAYLGADMGIQGEGESAFVKLLDRLQHHADISGVPGLYLPEFGLQDAVTFAKTLDDYPLPLPGKHLDCPSSLEEQPVWLPFQTRRGCPMGCNYCSTATIEGRILRKYPVTHVVKALARYTAAGFDHVFFVDNIFNIPSSYAKALCDQLLEAGLKLTWRCILYPWKVDEELIEKMARAGCTEVSLGFESGSEKILRIMNKRFRPREVRRISKMLNTCGIRQMGFLLLGGPGEDRQTVEESLTFAESLELDAMKVTVGIRIYPHTPLAQSAIKDEVLKPGEDLLFPKFYVVKGMEDCLRETVNTWISERTHWHL